jgi:hypothetical protein
MSLKSELKKKTVPSWLPAMSGSGGMLGVAAFNPSLRALALTGVVWLVGLGLQEWAHLQIARDAASTRAEDGEVAASQEVIRLPLFETGLTAGS